MCVWHPDLLFSPRLPVDLGSFAPHTAWAKLERPAALKPLLWLQRYLIAIVEYMWKMLCLSFRAVDLTLFFHRNTGLQEGTSSGVRGGPRRLIIITAMDGLTGKQQQRHNAINLFYTFIEGEVE